ncbi:hypothetical protein [Cellulomonas sp. URHD0024]|uniref:hypothetical protein n=1 Tax=Cellulomonas sp. URHD0024 TaxID=1302620 RepID=UPI0004289317|nr:hypothetical protein [Cellulomonas sp. URHD0024]
MTRRPTHRDVTVLLGAACVGMLVLTACAGRPAASAAAGTASAFYSAIGSSDGAAACGLLTPAARHTLESDADESCDEAVLGGDVGTTLEERADPRPASTVSVAGREAQVVLSTDVVFLTITGSTWRITAVGCDPRPQRPYRCVVEGS